MDESGELPQTYARGQYSPPSTPDSSWASCTLTDLARQSWRGDTSWTSGFARVPTPVDDSRPFTPNSAWAGATLQDLARNSERGKKFPERDGRLPTPSYRKGDGQRVDASLLDSVGEDDLSDTSSFNEGDEPPAEEIKNRLRVRRQSIAIFGQQTSQVLPDPEMILARIRSGQGGLSESDQERYTATFMRHKDPDGPDVQKSELIGMLTFLGHPSPSPERVRIISDTCSPYETLEKDEYLSFMEKYIAWEHAQYKALFDEFDEDGSGELDADELMKFLSSLGFIPLRNMVKEALDMVDLDGSGNLDFEEIVLLLHVYNNSEGFSVEEVKDFTAVYQAVENETQKKKSSQAGLPPEKLFDVLSRFFGPGHARAAKELSQECLTKMGRANDDSMRPPGEKAAMGLSFRESLLWARRLRQKIFQTFQDVFKQYDVDGDNTIDMDELQNIIASQGFTMTRRTINMVKEEAFAKVDLSRLTDNPGKRHSSVENKSMDFDCFVQFMQIVQKTDGFSKAEVQDILTTFAKFDEDGSGDIDVLELIDMLRWMGHSTSVLEARSLNAEVDFNGSGALDQREFIRFMRLHREKELMRIRNVFESLRDAGTGRLAPEMQEKAMKLLMTEDDKSQNSVAELEIKCFLTEESLDLDGFITVCDRVRDLRVAVNRKRAGFSDTQLAAFQSLFDSFDHKRLGVLTTEETTKLLGNIGFEVRTVEEQQDMKAALTKARQDAIAAGIEVSGAAPVNFYVLLQLLRALYRRSDKAWEAQLSSVAETTKFSNTEVAEFQEIFQACWAQQGAAEDALALESKKRLSTTSLFMLLRATMGFRIDSAAKERLSRRVSELSGVPTGDSVDFGGFLLLMRWMLDTNFINVNGALA